jgi:hypothetical protein
MKKLLILAAVWLAGIGSASAEVTVTLRDGLVTVVAKDATARQILIEWAKVGQAKVVNGDRVPGGPISLELTNVSEAHVLEILLRGVSGYVAAPRVGGSATDSQYSSVIVMPTSVAPRSTPLAAAPPQPVFQQPQFAQPQLPDDGDDDKPAAPSPNPRGPVFNTFPQPQVVNPQLQQGQFPQPVGVQQPPAPPVQQQVAPQPPPPSAFPTAPFGGGVAVPGMVAPAPQPQPGVITAPGQVPATRRPGGDE